MFYLNQFFFIHRKFQFNDEQFLAIKQCGGDTVRKKIIHFVVFGSNQMRLNKMYKQCKHFRFWF